MKTEALTANRTELPSFVIWITGTLPGVWASTSLAKKQQACPDYGFVKSVHAYFQLDGTLRFPTTIGECSEICGALLHCRTAEGYVEKVPNCYCRS